MLQCSAQARTQFPVAVAIGSQDKVRQASGPIHRPAGTIWQSRYQAPSKSGKIINLTPMMIGYSGCSLNLAGKSEQAG